MNFPAFIEIEFRQFIIEENGFIRLNIGNVSVNTFIRNQAFDSAFVL